MHSRVKIRSPIFSLFNELSLSYLRFIPSFVKFIDPLTDQLRKMKQYTLERSHSLNRFEFLRPW